MKWIEELKFGGLVFLNGRLEGVSKVQALCVVVNEKKFRKANGRYIGKLPRWDHRECIEEATEEKLEDFKRAAIIDELEGLHRVLIEKVYPKLELSKLIEKRNSVKLLVDLNYMSDCWADTVARAKVSGYRRKGKGER